MVVRNLAITLVAGLGSLTVVLSALYLIGSRWDASLETEPDGALPPDVPGRLVRVNGHNVHVVDRGDGEAILLVHGTAGTTLDWETSVLDALAQDHRVIAV